MRFQLIRSATIVLEYAGKRIIIDPNFAAKHTMSSYAGKSLNPLIDLPYTPVEVIQDIDLVAISHLHSDHFDQAAQQLLPKNLPILCRDEDEEKIKDKGFRNVLSIAAPLNWEGMEITSIACQHGSGEVLQAMGSASGFVFKHESELTVYWAGDTIWCKAVEETLDKAQPAIIITHSCGAIWGDQVPIVMDAEQTVAVCLAAPASTVIATHMEAFDHSTVSRGELRKYAESKGISATQLLIPRDGELYTF